MSFVRPLLQIRNSQQPLMRYIARTMATEMNFTFSSPSEVYYNQAKNVKQIDVSTLSGSVGLLANHVPILAALRPGIVAVHENEGKVNKYFVSSGSVAVNPDSSIQLLAEECFPLDRLDLKAAQEQLAEGQRLLAAAGNEKQKAEAQIHIETAEAVIRAVQSGI